MFSRSGVAVKIEHVYKDFDACSKEWLRSAAITVDANSFDYDPNLFLYYRARAITADTANSNGDFFPWAEIKAAYPTFIGKGVYYNHDNDHPSKAFGVILDAELIEDGKYVEILCALDKELAEEKQPGLLHRVQTGFVNATSMSCLAREAVCGICYNKAHDMPELCAHMNPESLHYVKGKRIDSTRIAYEMNYGITFTEDSIVCSPADGTARIFEVFAQAKQANVNTEISIKLQELVELFKGLR